MADFWESGVDGPTTFSNGAGARLRTINETFSSHPWDIAEIAGMRLPGICEVMDGLTEIGVDVAKADGKDGSQITVKGYRPGPFIIACKIWTGIQMDELLEVIDAVWRRPQKRAKIASIAVSVYHVALDWYGINSGALVGVTFPRNGDFEGSKVVHFKFLESVPPGEKRQTKKVDKNAGIVPKTKQDSPINETPTPPSKDKKVLGPKGPAARPANGSR